MPPDVYLYLREARGELRRSRPPKSVIDAGIAAEIALSEWNRAHPWSGPGKDPIHAKATLGDYVKHATADIPADAQAALVIPRNDAIHNGIKPTFAQARRALEVAEAIVGAALPLNVPGLAGGGNDTRSSSDDLWRAAEV